MLHSFWILGATFFTVLTYVCVKWVPAEYSIWDIFFVRSSCLALFAAAAAAYARTPLLTKYPKTHVVRAACGIVALAINVVTVQHLQIGTSQTLFYTMPLFVTLFVIAGKMRQGLPADWHSALAVAVGFIGICLVMQPSFGEDTAVYAGAAVASAVLAASSSLILKRLGTLGEPMMRTIFWFSTACLAASLTTELLLSRMPWSELFTEPALLAVGLCTLGAQLAQTQGWGRGRPMLCAVLQFSAIFFAVFFGWLFFDEQLEDAAALGMLVIIAAELASAWFNAKSLARAKR